MPRCDSWRYLLEGTYLFEIGLEEVNLLLRLQQTGPELLLQLLLSQDQLDLTVVVVDLGVFGVDLGKQIQRNIVSHAFLGVSGERNVLLGDVEGSRGAGNIGSLDVHVEVIALRIIIGGALGPCDWKGRQVSKVFTVYAK